MDQTATAVRLGHAVPDFKMETFEPGIVDFSEFSIAQQKKNKKWTVLFFYPADFTFVWATEFAALAEQHAEFTKLGADIVTVSTDTKFSHLAWQRYEKMLERAKYTMASDVTGAVSRLFGVYDDATGLALRGAFIINPEGVLVNSEVNFYNLGRNVEELLRKLRANIHMASNPTEVCPAQWKKEGDKTLKPSAKIVGKIYEAMN